MMPSFTSRSSDHTGPNDRRYAMTASLLLQAMCSMLLRICCDISGLTDCLATPMSFTASDCCPTPCRRHAHHRAADAKEAAYYLCTGRPVIDTALLGCSHPMSVLFLQALHSMLERELWKKLPMIPGGLPSLTDAVEGPHSPPGPGQIAAAPGAPQLSSSSAFEQWAAQGNPWRAGPGLRCVHAMLRLARGAAHVAGQRRPFQPARAVSKGELRCVQGSGACRLAVSCRTTSNHSPARHSICMSIVCIAADHACCRGPYAP